MKRKRWLPAICCGVGGALGALAGYFYGLGLTPPVPQLAALGAAVGAVCGSYFFALIE